MMQITPNKPAAPAAPAAPATPTPECTKIRPAEGGFYAQLLSVGAYVGYNKNSGFNLGVSHQVSAGVASYASAGFSVNFEKGFQFQKNIGVGAAAPTGVPSPVTGGVFYNMDKTVTTQVGTGVTDLVEAGGYAVVGKEPCDPKISIGAPPTVQPAAAQINFGATVH